MMKFVTILLVSSLLSIELTQSAKVHIVDANDGQVDLDYIAKAICWKNSGLHNQISRLSTIDKLIEYFEGLPVEHQFSSCANRNLGLIKQLKTLISTGNDNICSNKKLALLESFHHNYLSNQRRAQLIEAPKMIKTFFMHYSAQISEICAERSVQFFSSTSNKEVNLPSVDQLLEQVRKTTGAKSKLSSYEDLFFIWGLLDSMPKKMHGKVADYVVTGPKRMTVRSENAGNLLSIQEMCLDLVKPIYSNTLLPAIRLIDLGYYPSNSRFLDQLNDNSFVNRLYKLTLLCETTLPVRILEADSSQVVLVKPEESFNESGVGEEEINSVAIEPASWTVDSLATVTESQAKLVAKRVYADLKQRRRHLWAIIKRVVKGMRKSEQETIILSDTKENFDESVKDVVDKVDEVELGDANDELDEPQTKGLTRKRRGGSTEFGRTFVKFLVSVCRITVVILIYVIKLVVAFLSGTALFLATLTGLEDVKVQLSNQIGMMDFSVRF